MPKQKTSSGAKKKFKVTGTGKILRRKAGQSHNLEHKSPKRKRAFSKDQPVAEANDRTVRRMLGLKKRDS
jgi:large subunit ribosomal protein L35